MRRQTILVIGLLSVVCLTSRSARAAEGGFSFFLPGLAGDIAFAQATEPGTVQVANTVYIQKGDIDAAVLQGRVNVGLDLMLVLDVISASYTFEREILGARYSVAAAIPFGEAELEATIQIPGVGSRQGDRDAFDIADIAIVPLDLSWDIGDFSIELAQAIFAPTGAYDEDEVVNLGLNHWGFDTTLAATYLNEETGTEVSIQPGILVNTKNEETKYRTGDEFHLDFAANQFLAETFAIGIRGYYYRQVSGDKGRGAILGDFKGESFAIGPGVVWFPKFAGGKLAVLAKWMRDLTNDRRFDSDFGSVTIAWTF